MSLPLCGLLSSPSFLLHPRPLDASLSLLSDLPTPAGVGSADFCWIPGCPYLQANKGSPWALWLHISLLRCQSNPGSRLSQRAQTRRWTFCPSLISCSLTSSYRVCEVAASSRQLASIPAVAQQVIGAHLFWSENIRDRFQCFYVFIYYLLILGAYPSCFHMADCGGRMIR